MSDIGFRNIPQNLRVPLFFAEVDPTGANTASVIQRALVIGQITGQGAAVANVPLICQSPADAKLQGGPGSMLALAAGAYKNADPFGEVWYLPLADDPAATAAVGTVTFGATPTIQGVVSLYVAGQLVSVAVTAGEAAASIAAAVGAQINLQSDLPVTATVVGSAVTVTAKNKGADAGAIDLRLNYRSAAGGEATPPGLGLAITPMAGGSVNPNLTVGLANLQDMPFDFIVFPFGDGASLAAIKAFLGDVTGRWSWLSQVYGHAFSTVSGSYGVLSTFGPTQNNAHQSQLGLPESPTPNYVWSASTAGAAASSLRVDPLLPLHTLEIPGVLPPQMVNRFSLPQRNNLLFDGVSTFTVDVDGTVRIESLITTYQTNAFGQPDDSYLKVERMYGIMAILRRLRSVITTTYGRKKLADDGVRAPPGSNVVTPNIVRAALIAEYQTMQDDEGLVQNAAAFATGLIVERDPKNRNRLNVLFPADIIDQLDDFALLLQFV